MKKFKPAMVGVVLLITMFLPMIAIHLFSIGLNTKYFSVSDFSNLNDFAIKLKNPNDTISQFLQDQLEQSTKDLLNDYDGILIPSKEIQDALIKELNLMIESVQIYDEARFYDVELSVEVKQLIAENPQGTDVIRLNRILLEDAYPQEIKKTQNRAPSEITVGLIVILRATFRRLMRGFSTNILQTTIGTFGRTSARAVTRRFVRFVGRILFGSIMQGDVDQTEAEQIKKLKKTTPLGQMVALILGVVGLCFSFWGILHVISPEKLDALIIEKGLSVIEASVIAGIPLLAYAFLHKFIGKKIGVQTAYRTEIDGLVLQAYFTGAGSFLPMTTDVEYYGDEKTHCKLAVAALTGMFAFFGIFYLVGEVFDMASLSFLGSMFLIYCFVYCFPIQPLEGHIIWTRSKLLWLAVALPILAAFVGCMDSGFGDIL